jgi:hypothetical protein
MTETIFNSVVSEFLASAKKLKEFPPRIPPAPSCGAETKRKKLFKKNQSLFCESSSRKIASQNRVHCVFSVFPHFCFGRSTTLRVVALQRAGNASISL